jgi:hypothetical protein
MYPSDLCELEDTGLRSTADLWHPATLAHNKLAGNWLDPLEFVPMKSGDTTVTLFLLLDRNPWGVPQSIAREINLPMKVVEV